MVVRWGEGVSDGREARGCYGAVEGEALQLRAPLHVPSPKAGRHQAWRHRGWAGSQGIYGYDAKVGPLSKVCPVKHAGGPQHTHRHGGPCGLGFTIKGFRVLGF